MDFAHSEEQLALRGAARDWLGDHYPADKVVALADASDTGAEPDVWSQLEKLGWVDAATDGAVTTGVLLEETGAALLPSPFFSTVALAGPLGADTSVPTTLAWAEKGAPLLGDAVSTAVDADGRVTGTKVLVPDLGSATHAVVTTSSGNRVVALADCTVVPRSTLDRTRRLGDVVLDGVASTELPAVDADKALATMLALSAAEAVGVARRCLEISAEHTKIREQFGRIIGTYQGVSHKVADMFVRLELARSLSIWACWAIDADDPSALTAAHAAKAFAGPAAVLTAEHAIQVHGGLGMTWDSVLHRYYKRAQWLDAFQGGQAVQRAAVADDILGKVA